MWPTGLQVDGKDDAAAETSLREFCLIRWFFCLAVTLHRTRCTGDEWAAYQKSASFWRFTSNQTIHALGGGFSFWWLDYKERQLDYLGFVQWLDSSKFINRQCSPFVCLVYQTLSMQCMAFKFVCFDYRSVCCYFNTKQARWCNHKMSFEPRLIEVR